jgi:uroporphyrinogen decarboxylase
VTRECRRIVQVLGRNGGYIAAPSHAIQVGTPPENVVAMLQAVLGDADFAQALQDAKTAN